MIPELEPLEKVFRRIALAVGRPWPVDRWLGAMSRMYFCKTMRDWYEARAVRKLDEIDAARARFETLQAEGREILDHVRMWDDFAKAYLSVADDAIGTSGQHALALARIESAEKENGWNDDGPRWQFVDGAWIDTKELRR